MKQFTRVVTRPDTIDPIEWRAALLNIHIAINSGMAITQGDGVHSASFVDLSNATLVITIIQFEHASQEIVTKVHQTITDFVETVSKL